MQHTAAPDPALLRVLESARRFLACRDEAAALASGRQGVARDLAEAIARDFVPFDLETAAEALRAAVQAAPNYNHDGSSRRNGVQY